MTVPLVLLVALGFGAAGGGNESDSMTNPTTGALPPVTAPAPPQSAAQAASCAQVLAELPVQLGKLDPRVVHTTPDSPYVVAWGSPAVVLACGVDKPKSLYPGSDEQLFNAGDLAGPYYSVSRSGDANVYTIIDRQPYIAITVPGQYAAAVIFPTLVGAVGKALPTAVCSTDPSTPDPAKLCTRRTT